MEEHLSAVRTLCGFADDRIADINQLHDRFEERIEDLHASHRWAALRTSATHTTRACGPADVCSWSERRLSAALACVAETLIGSWRGCTASRRGRLGRCRRCLRWPLGCRPSCRRLRCPPPLLAAMMGAAWRPPTQHASTVLLGMCYRALVLVCMVQGS